MSAVAREKPYVSLEEYLRMEVESEEKYEWRDGEVVAKAGAPEPQSYCDERVASVG